jgi:general secretion pathway protein H
MRRDDGFTLIEVVVALAIVGLLAALVLPLVPQTTTRPKLEAVAIAMAGLLKGDRVQAIELGRPVSSALDPEARSLRSGATGRIVQAPEDVQFDAILPKRCGDHAAGRTIEFLPSGMSCGGVIALARQDVAFQIKVNWLTGGVEIVQTSGS